MWLASLVFPGRVGLGSQRVCHSAVTVCFRREPLSLGVRHQGNEGERSDVPWRAQALRDPSEEQPAGQGQGQWDPCAGRGPCGFTGSDGLEARGVWFYKALLRGRDGVAGVEEPWAQLGTSWGTSHEAESRLGLRMGGRKGGWSAALRPAGRPLLWAELLWAPDLLPATIGFPPGLMRWLLPSFFP